MPQLTMKKQFLTTIFLTVLLFGAHATKAPISDVPIVQTLSEGYYVTIGVYAKSKEFYAKKYVEKATSMGYEADYGFNPSRNYYYVYIFYTENYKQALAEMRKARQVEEFKEAWVYVHMSDIVGQPSSDAVSKTKTEKTKEKTESTDEPVDEQVKEEKTEEPIDSVAVEETVEGEEVEETTEKEVEKEGGLKVHFNVVNARTQDPIGGEVQVIDVERSKLLEAVSAGDTLAITDPNNRTGNLALIVDNFGFRKNQLPFNYYEPDTTERFIRKVGDHYEIDFDMIRYHKGDIVTMYNVYFFQNASVMRPASKFELESLLDMMQENPNYKIRIHGHTNGNKAGQIISLGESDNFFALTEENKDGFGSAKKLSEERADIVKQFLIANGIDANRMEIKGWGGKRMIHEKLGHRARHNVRVEIEILEE